MTRRIQILKVSPADAQLDKLTLEELRALLSSIPGVSVPALHRADVSALRSAARTYIRIGRLTEAAVLATKKEKA